ncbi:MAG TPA: AAA family ATPase [Candidatus Nanopelagicales bacterium]|nr:AAA family ATPase [Candidatus Nanopelagicales bacterium]
MSLVIPIGIDDYRELREGRFEYVDKTHLIQEILDKPGVKVLLLPRPRRFGKSVNLSMLRCFFERHEEDLWHLFEGLSIARAGAAYREHFQRYPVIAMSFKGTKAETHEVCWERIKVKIQALYHEHRALLDEGRLDEWDSRDFRAILDGTAHEALYGASLLKLTGYLHRAYGVPAVVLIDEYDEPIHAAYLHGYAGPVLDFFRTFLTDGLKGNPHLHRGVLTGILRIAKESIFSGLNNLGVYTLLSYDFSTSFGFTEADVRALLEKAGVPELLDAVRGFYNGYLFGGQAIYNPWSILSFLDSAEKQLRPYWMATSSNDLVRELLQTHAVALQAEMEVLLAGGSVEKRIDERVVLGSLREDAESIWSLLVFSGYLKADQGELVIGQPPPPCLLAIPNAEVGEVYRTTFHAWMDQGLKAEGGALKALLAALLQGRAEAFEQQLQAFARHVLSYHDVGASDPERFYQGLMLGLLAGLEPDYEVRSNRESGDGRPDVMIRPRRAGRPGVVLELKTARRGEKTLARALQEGLRQIRQGDYEAELRAGGAAQVHSFVVAFDGKEVRVQAGKAAETKASGKSVRGQRKPAKKAATRRR